MTPREAGELLARFAREHGPELGSVSPAELVDGRADWMALGRLGARRIDDVADAYREAGGAGHLSYEDRRFHIAPLSSGPRLSSGVLVIDQLLGGGYPLGRLTTLVDGGTSLLAEHAARRAAAATQRAGRIVSWIDLGGTFDVREAEADQIRLDQILVSQPDALSLALGIAEVVTRSATCGLVVLSVPPALSSTVNAVLEDGTYLADALARLTIAAERSGTTVLVVLSSATRPRAVAWRMCSTVVLAFDQSSLLSGRVTISVPKSKIGSAFAAVDTSASLAASLEAS